MKSKFGGVVTLECLVNVCLAAPIVSSRALVRAFRDVKGLDSDFLSRPTMTKIRDAWIGYYVQMHIDECASLVAELWGGGTKRPAFVPVTASGGRGACKRRKLLAAAAAGALGFPAAAGASSKPMIRAIALPHFHDEAALRLRSLVADRPAAATRSRSSKVQQHVVRVFTAMGVWEYPTELEPLVDKTAATIATTLDGVLRGFCAAISKSLGPGEVWLLHIAIGDGISSNERAGRILLAKARATPLLEGRVVYFLGVIRCATHQAGLAAKDAVIGKSSKLAGRVLRSFVRLGHKN